MTAKTYELQSERVDAGLVLRVKGKFDRQTGDDIQELLSAQAQAGDIVVLTLADVDYISSSGVASLVKLSASQGVRLAAVAECVLHVVSLAGIQPILHLFPSEAEALAAAS